MELAQISDNHVRLALETLHNVPKVQACDAILRVKHILYTACEGRDLAIPQKRLDYMVRKVVTEDPAAEPLLKEILLIEPDPLAACAVLESAFRIRSSM